MGLLNKKPDPISDKARALNDQIAALEAEIKKLDTQIVRPPQPKFRSTVPPSDEKVSRPVEKPVTTPAPKASASVFEEVHHAKLPARGENAEPELFNELGVRKIRPAGAVEPPVQSFSRPDDQQSPARQLSGRRRGPRPASAALREARGAQPFSCAGHHRRRRAAGALHDFPAQTLKF